MMQGNVACAEAALAAGCRFFAGYPITPSSEIAEVMSRKLPALDGSFIQMEDEIASMGAVIGASLGGAKAMTATSGPGFSLKQENLGFAVMAEIPVVVVNVQRGGPSTGMPTLASQGDVMQSRWGTHGDHPIIVLSPSSVQESFDLTVRAFNLAEKYRSPVILLSDEIIAHLTEKVSVPPTQALPIDNREQPTADPRQYLPYQNTASGIPVLANFGTGYRYHVTGLAHNETGFPTNDPQEIDQHLGRLNHKLNRHRADIVEVEAVHTDDMDTLIIAYGSPARSARRAVTIARQEGLKVGLLRLKTLWPFADQEIEALSQRVQRIIIPEMNLGQIAHEVEWVTRRSVPIHKISRINGEAIKPQEIYARIKEERQ